MLHRFRKSQEDNEGGFTLIELLVVIIIIGILAAIAIPVFLNQRKKAVDASIKSDLRTVAVAEETYFTDKTVYVSGATGENVKFSQGNTVVGAITANGYCLKGSNPAGTAIGGTGGFFWYDSSIGGLQSGAATATAPSGGICASTGLTFNTMS